MSEPIRDDNNCMVGLRRNVEQYLVLCKDHTMSIYTREVL